jgi:hypothetical protein
MNIAERVIEKCGGVAKTAELINKSPSWVYRWTYPKDKGGTGGTVPQSSQHELLKLAKEGKVTITPADFFEA